MNPINSSVSFNQGGEGLMEPGSEVHRSADFARGYVGTLAFLSLFTSN